MDIAHMTPNSDVTVIGFRGAWTIESDGELISNKNGIRYFRTLDSAIRVVSARTGHDVFKVREQHNCRRYA